MSKSLAEHLAEVRRAIPVGDGAVSVDATAPITEYVDLSEYRPIASHEKAVLIALLERSGPEAAVFLQQVEDLLVTPSCTCGCPTLSLAVAEHHAKTAFRGNIVADMVGEAGDGLVGLLVFQAGGKLTCLEAYDLAGRDGKYEFPLAEAISPFEAASGR